VKKSTSAKATTVKATSRVSDHVTKRSEVDKVVKMVDFFDQELTISKVDFLKGQKGDYCFITFNVDGDDTLFGVSCGGAVVVRKLREVCEKGKLPVLAKITMVKNYYDIN